MDRIIFLLEYLKAYHWKDAVSHTIAQTQKRRRSHTCLQADGLLGGILHFSVLTISSILTGHFLLDFHKEKHHSN